MITPQKITLMTDDAQERLKLEGIQVVTNEKGEQELQMDENMMKNLENFYEVQFERPVHEIKAELSTEEQTTLAVFSQRKFSLPSQANMTNATDLYNALPKKIQGSISQRAFEDAFNSVKPECREHFLRPSREKPNFPMKISL